MTNIYCVRADFGKNTHDFIKGGYVAIGWIPNDDLSQIEHRDELYPLYRKEYPQDVVVGQHVGIF